MLPCFFPAYYKQAIAFFRQASRLNSLSGLLPKNYAVSQKNFFSANLAGFATKAATISGLL